VRLADDEVKLALALYYDSEWVKEILGSACPREVRPKAALSPGGQPGHDESSAHPCHGATPTQPAIIRSSDSISEHVEHTAQLRVAPTVSRP
jgi:hypothetical protein